MVKFFWGGQAPPRPPHGPWHHSHSSSATVARCADTDDSVRPLDWWKRNSTDLPKWSAAAVKVLLIQPSSATTERVFSLLKASFSEQQDHSLQDYIEVSLMFQYNYH